MLRGTCPAWWGEALAEEDDHALLDPDEAYNLKVNAWHGAAQNGAITLVNTFLGIDLIRLGGTDFEVGLLSSLPPLASTVSTLAGARIMSRNRRPHRTTVWLFLAARSAFLGFAVLNLVRGPWAPVLLVTLVGLMNVPQAVANVTWQAWITGLFRERSRPLAFSRRQLMVSLAGIAVPLAGGLVIADVPGVSGYPGLFTVAFLVALVEVWLFSRLRGHPRIQALPPHLVPAFRRLWADDRFRHYTLASLPFYLGWVMAWPLFLRWQVDVDHASNLWIAILPATNAACSAIMARVWGRLGDRHAVGVLLPLAILGLSFVPFVYALGPSLPELLISAVIGGATGAGVNMFLLLRLMQVTPDGDRIIGMALANTLIGIASVVGPLFSTFLATFLPMPGVFWIPFALRFFGGLAFLAAYNRSAGRGLPSLPLARHRSG
jgi:MFS family permease